MISFKSFAQKTSFSLLMLITLLLSCKTNTNSQEYKNATIKEDEFVKLMVDMRIADIIIRKQISIGNNSTKITKRLYDSIFEKYNITKEEFENNIKLYSANPAKMYEINERVVEQLSQLESEVKAQKMKSEPQIEK